MKDKIIEDKIMKAGIHRRPRLDKMATGLVPSEDDFVFNDFVV